MSSIPQLSRLASALLAELRRLDPGRPFRASHRDLADALGCSAGSLPRLMQQLEDTGHIARTQHRNTFLIVLLEADRNDQPAAPAVDRFDRPDLLEADRNDQFTGVDRNDQPRRAAHQDAVRATSPQNRVKPGCKEDHDLVQEEDSPPDRDLLSARARETDPALIAQMLADKVQRDKIAPILAARPDLTLVTWPAEVAGAKARGKGIGYLVKALLAGSTLVLPAAAGDVPISPDAQAYGNGMRRGSDLTDLDPALLRYLPLGVIHAA